MPIDMPVIGVDRYCPDCGRLLVEVTGDGTARLAPKAQAWSSSETYVDDDGVFFTADHAVVTEAICHLRLCQFKRFVRTLRRRK